MVEADIRIQSPEDFLVTADCQGRADTDIHLLAAYLVMAILEVVTATHLLAACLVMATQEVVTATRLQEACLVMAIQGVVATVTRLQEDRAIQKRPIPRYTTIITTVPRNK